MKVYSVMLLLILAISLNLLLSRAETSIVLENKVIENQELDYYKYQQVIIRNCILRNTSVSVNTVGRFVIEKSRFEESPAIAITVWQTDDAVISQNTFVNTPEAAIEVYESNHIHITNNSISLASTNSNRFAIYNGIKVDRSPNAVIQGNEVISPLGDGMTIFTSPHTTVKDNFIHDTGFVGFSATSSENITVTDNEFVDSSSYHRTHADAPPSSAVMLNDCPNSLVSLNNIDYSDNVGIDLTSSSRSNVSFNSVSNHPVGIFIGLSQQVILQSNTFVNNNLNLETDQSSVTFVSTNSAGEIASSTLVSSSKTASYILEVLWLVPLGLALRKRYGSDLS